MKNHNRILKLLTIAFGAIFLTSFLKQSYKKVDLNNIFTKQEEKYATSTEDLQFCFTDTTASIDQLDNYGYKWDLSTKTLTLKNFDLSKAQGIATYLK